MQCITKPLWCLFALGLLSMPVAAKQKTVLVVGAGIVGSSIAYHLSKENFNVVIIDMQAPASHATRGTFAWINASWAKQPQAYHGLNQTSANYWHTISEKLDIPVKWGGSLEWFISPQRQSKLSEQIAQQRRWNEDASMLSVAEAKKLDPMVNFIHANKIAYSKNDGAVDPVLATQQFLAAAEQNGASVRYPCKLLSTLASDETKVAKTTCGDIAFDKLVLAVGAASDTISSIAKMDIPQRTTPGIIVVTKPLPPTLNKIIVAPGVHIHQRIDGRVVLGEQDGAPKTENHQNRLKQRPNDYPSKDLANQHANRILKMASEYVPAISNAEIENVYIGWRPLPLDGHPVLGYSDKVPYVYIAVTHSGVTLAPIIGLYVTQEMRAGFFLKELKNYRPQRHFHRIKRY